jgi:carbonic anhydrase/acetyltransferase-like protein (isoleucine patch superfamily)
VLVPIRDDAPEVDPTSWVAPTAVLAGQVKLGARSSVWYSAVVRADFGPITIGERTNIQDGTVLHTDPGLHLVMGNGITVGHLAVIHGCTIEDDVMVGMGCIVMNGAVIGAESVLAAGALIPEGVVIPPGSLVVGAPGKVRRETTSDERLLIRASADGYVDMATQHARA